LANAASPIDGSNFGRADAAVAEVGNLGGEGNPKKANADAPPAEAVDEGDNGILMLQLAVVAAETLL